MKHLMIAVVTLLLINFVIYGTENKEPARPNILFIAVDDLRTELGCYGNKHIKSPNIDKLAAQSTVFEHAYCMSPICNISRSTLLTGIRPKYNRFDRTHLYPSKDVPNAIPLHTHFKNHGYTTICNGKVCHLPAIYNDGWSEPAW
jgi:arylsulfatase A-like enzyme